MKVKLDWSTFPLEMDLPEHTTEIYIPIITGHIQMGPENKEFTVVDPSMALLFQNTNVDKDGTPIFTFIKGVQQ